MSWKLSAFAQKADIQAALLAHDELDDWDFNLVISGSEVAEDRPNDWVLEAWFPGKPGTAQTSALASLFAGKAPPIVIEHLEEQDWLAISQQGAQPITAGPFYVHTPNHPPNEGAINFEIPAAQAFGTGQHETTAGCLEMLATMKRTGMVVNDLADIGTGTGLLAFAGLALWPSARATGSDIDPVCAPVVEDNAVMNAIPLGSERGELTMVIADGMDNSLLNLRGPYDLLIANILAGPLVELAPSFSQAVKQGGSLVLAGLLTEQERRVRQAYRRAGFRLTARLIRGDWSILWLRKRRKSWANG